jgi:hypothetical protein
MNVISKCLSDIKRSIPKQLLEAAFIGKAVTTYAQARSVNIDDQITNNVIKPRVLIDCNLVGGTQAVIPLEGLHQSSIDNQQVIIHIPKDRTQGRSINSVLNVSFFSGSNLGSYLNGSGGGSSAYGTYGNQQGNTALMGAAQGVMNSYDQIPLVSTSRVQLISENTILIKDNIILTPNCFLRCVLDNDDDLNHIQLRSYRYISQLVEYAVKSYVYNELIIEVGQGRLQGGVELGVFKDILSGYSDAEQNYKDYLNDVIESVLFMNDSESYSRLIKLTIGSNR